jgi:OFA family oxalate/formate antiporter-like MFS transporter
MKRWGVLLCGLLVELCIGGVYAWSVLDNRLQSEQGLSALQTQAIFSAIFAVFTLIMVAAGRYIKRVGPRRMVLLSGVLLGGGFLLAGYSQGSFPWLITGFGLGVGAGVGVAYVTCLTIVLGWFPERKGLATGLIVAAFGGGAVALSLLASLLNGLGLDVLGSLRTIGLIYGAAVCLAALGLAPPPLPATAATPTPDRSTKTDGTGIFYLLCAGMLAGTFAGMLVIGSLKNIGETAGVGVKVATTAVSIFAVANALGRVTWGHLHDRFGFRTLPVALLLLGITTWVLMGAAVPAVFLVATFGVGFGFGSCFVLYPAQVARSFGAAAVATVYPVVFLFYGLSGLLGPVLAGLLKDLRGNYTAALLIAGAVATAGAIAVGVLARVVRHEHQPAE